MTFNKEGEQVNVYDYVAAATIEENDCIAHETDLIEVSLVVDETDTVMIRGYSHVSGDTVTYFIPADKEVGLWTV